MKNFLYTADYLIKFLFCAISACFISSIINRNQQMLGKVDIVMYGIIILILLDCLFYILGSYRKNIMINKAIRGCMWGIAIYVCSTKEIVVLVLLIILFWGYMSKNKRIILDVPFTFMVSCICMEIIWNIHIFLAEQYQYALELLNHSIIVDILFIISLVLYSCSDSFILITQKIPSVEKDDKTDSHRINEELDIHNQIVYLGIVFLGIMVGLHMYNSLYINKGYLRICISSSMILLQSIVLYVIFGEVFNKLGKERKLIISIGAVCFPYINYKDYSLKASLIYLIVFLIILAVFKLFRDNKIRWTITIIFTIVMSILLFFRGFYIIPVINILLGVLLGIIIQNRTYIVIATCVVMMVVSQIVVGYKLIRPIRPYNGIIQECTDFVEKINAEIYYVGDDIQVSNILYDNGMNCYFTSYDSINSSGVIIFDKGTPEKYLMHKYIIFQDDKFIVCLNDANLAQQYQELGGECSRKECESQIDLEYDSKLKEAKFIISNLTEGYHDIVATVWCQEKGVEDMKSYNLEELENGVFKGTIGLSQYSYGEEITIHVYGTFENEDSSFINGIVYTISIE